MAEQQQRRKKGNRTKEKESEWQERVVQIRRVTKVVKGGKKLSFRAIVIVGNEKGQVGVGVGKAADVIGAVKKGVADGRKNVVEVPLTKSNSIPHPANGEGGGAQVMMRPAAPGTGVIAGGAVRSGLGTGRGEKRPRQATRLQQPPQQRPGDHQRPVGVADVLGGRQRTRYLHRTALRLTSGGEGGAVSELNDSSRIADS